MPSSDDCQYWNMAENGLTTHGLSTTYRNFYTGLLSGATDSTGKKIVIGHGFYGVVCSAG